MVARKPSQRIRIRLKAYDHKVLDQSASKIVETADAGTIFGDPLHPYMVSLFRSMPVVGGGAARLNVIPGRVPDPRRFPTGCRFHPRCPMAASQCGSISPELRPIREGHQAACVRLEGYWGGSDPRARDLVVKETDRLANA